MRLSKRLQALIVEAVQSSFGDVAVYLFGSRVDESRRGGDIDIALEVKMTREAFRKKKVAFKTYLLQKGYDMKIDLVQWNQSIDTLLFSEIENNHVLLSEK